MFVQVLGDLHVTSHWIDTLVFKNCGKYLRYFVASPFPLQGKTSACSRGSNHYPLPFINQMLERLSRHTHLCFLYGYSGFSQIPVSKEDQEKTTFTCPFGTFSYGRMPFGLCNVPTTFQSCMTTIFSDFCETIVEVFMYYFSVYGSSFDDCLSNLDRVLERCDETNLS